MKDKDLLRISLIFIGVQNDFLLVARFGRSKYPLRRNTRSTQDPRLENMISHLEGTIDRFEMQH